MKKGLFSKMLVASAVVGLLSSSSSVFAQVKIGTNPTTIGANNNLEVEATTSGRKTSVDKTTGQVTIADGTQGDGKILTSDANGGASWQGGTSFVFYGTNTNTSASPYIVTSGLASQSVGQRIPFTASFGSGYDPINKTYTFPTAGFYRVTGAARCVGATATINVTMALRDGAGFTPSDQVQITTTSSTLRTFSIVGNFTAGSTAFYYINNQAGSNAECYTGFLAIEKITPP